MMIIINKKQEARLESDFEVKIGMQITGTRIKISTFGNAYTRCPCSIGSGFCTKLCKNVDRWRNGRIFEKRSK